MKGSGSVASQLRIGCVLYADVVFVGVGERFFIGHFLGLLITSLVGVHARIVEAEIVLIGIGPEL